MKGKKPSQLSAKRQFLDILGSYPSKHPQVDKTFKKPWFEVGNKPHVWIGNTGAAAQPIRVANDSRVSGIKKYNGALVNK